MELIQKILIIILLVTAALLVVSLIVVAILELQLKRIQKLLDSSYESEVWQRRFQKEAKRLFKKHKHDIKYAREIRKTYLDIVYFKTVRDIVPIRYFYDLEYYLWKNEELFYITKYLNKLYLKENML